MIVKSEPCRQMPGLWVQMMQCDKCGVRDCVRANNAFAAARYFLGQGWLAKPHARKYAHRCPKCARALGPESPAIQDLRKIARAGAASAVQLVEEVR